MAQRSLNISNLLRQRIRSLFTRLWRLTDSHTQAISTKISDTPILAFYKTVTIWIQNITLTKANSKTVTKMVSGCKPTNQVNT